MVDLHSNRSADPARASVAAVDGLDRTVVGSAAAGDRHAVGEVLGYVRPLVLRYCRARLGRIDRGAGSADDVAQEICMAVLGALPGYRNTGQPFMAFVYGIAAHKVSDAFRRVARSRVEFVPDFEEELSELPGPEEHAERHELAARMVRLLHRLPDQKREILVLRVVLGLSAQQAAEIVGCTPGAVRVIQHRALTTLRALLIAESRSGGPDPRNEGTSTADAWGASGELSGQEVNSMAVPSISRCVTRP
jgi:RNA polymerase sigma-70 factor, ECF subfamily